MITVTNNTTMTTVTNKNTDEDCTVNLRSIEYRGNTYYIIYIIRVAVADNYGTDGGVRYYARAIDANDVEHIIAWDTTEEWDLSCELDRLMANSRKTDEEIERIEELAAMALCDVSDESNACDWDNPAYVKAI